MILDLYSRMLKEGEKQDVKEWQSISTDLKMVELRNLYLNFPCPLHIDKLQKLLAPDLPWAEDHFKERINGEPLNPGKEWENWPYYSNALDDKRFRNNNGHLFDHTYMERFWPVKKQGIRYNMGDFNDILNRLKKNIHNRQSYLSIWHPEDQSNDKTNKRVPCTLGYYFQIRNNTIELTYHIRSCDLVRHLKNDLYMAGRLLQYVRTQVDRRLKIGNLYVWIGNLHCFELDLYYIEKQLLKTNK